jgi:hypothetical protein
MDEQIKQLPPEIDLTQLGLVPFHIIIGRIVTNWALLESTLDLLVALTWHQCGGHKVQKEIPRSLGPKLAYLEKALLRLPPYEAERQILADFMLNIRTLGTRRHWLVHGTILAPPEDLNLGPFVFHKISYERTQHKHIHSHQVLSMTMEELEDTLKNIYRFSTWILATFENLRKAVDEAGWIRREVGPVAAAS